MGLSINPVLTKTNLEIHKKYLIDPNYDSTKPKGDDLSKIRHTGFYYDAQLTDESMTMSLHPSTYNNGSRWEVFTDGYPPFKSAPDNMHYSFTPIATCLLSDDPSFSVSNNFTDFNGGNPIEDVFNSMKPFAPFLEKLGAGLENTSDDTMGATINDYLNRGKKVVGKFAKNAGEILNHALFIQGTRFSFYNGSSFSTGQMEMKFTKFSEYNSNGEFINVKDYIGSVLAPYCYGVYAPISDTGSKEGSFGSGLPGDMKKFIADYCGVQVAPGGFRMDNKSLDNALKGTLRLNIGGVYAIENLVIKSMTVSFSRSQSKNPEEPGATVPLYADISLSLCPASMVTDLSFTKMLSGNGLENSMTAKITDNKTQLEKMKADRKSSFSSVKIKNY